MSNVYFENKLTPADWELLRMVESLTGKPCEPKNGGDCFFFEADYTLHREPEYVGAVWDAICGRAGERLKEIRDDADRGRLLCYVEFSREKLPFQYGDERDAGKPDASAGAEYCHALETIRAVKVERVNLDGMQRFVGGGELRVPRTPGARATFHFINPAGLFMDAHEGEWICVDAKGRFSIMSDTEFRRAWERKESPAQ